MDVSTWNPLDPDFHSRAFSSALGGEDSGPIPEVAFLNNQAQLDELSRRADRSLFQEGCAIRNIFLCRTLAQQIINEKGEVQFSSITQWVKAIESNLYSLGPGREDDAVRQEHILTVLKQLLEDKETRQVLQSIHKPYIQHYADTLIRDTLLLPPHLPTTDSHARQAALVAWLSFLRQSVGSCFATAPAILIHQEQPIAFLKDLAELLATGRMKRTYAGIEYSVPLSKSWGGGDLKKPVWVPPGYFIEDLPLWESPGLHAAFESCGLLKAGMSVEEKSARLKELILQLLQKKEEVSASYPVTAGAIIRSLLLQWLDLKEEVEAYHKRQMGITTSPLQLVPAASSGEKKGKVDLFNLFSMMEEQANAAFKGMADVALLKAWEFTLASLSESKLQFTRWNLYASLGLGSQQKGGIGAVLYEKIKQKIEDCNRKIADIQYDYENLFAQLKQLEVTIKHSSTEQEAKWINVEYQSKRNEFYTLEEIRDDWNRKAHLLSRSFDGIVDIYDRLFPQYFQEVYDADIRDVAQGPFDDSPAGFRLLFKHGRSNTAQWTGIDSPQEFVSALISFFVMSEPEVRAEESFKEIDNELSDLVTALVVHVKTQEFLESALQRMAAAHGTRLPEDPLNHLEKVEKKPWVYTSGGTMNTLLSQYYKREQEPTKVSRWVENPTELLVFFVDTLKQCPQNIQELFAKQHQKNMLMQSPTHAFNMKPGYAPFIDGWKEDSFSYTWVRDQWIQPRKAFVEKLWLDEEAVHFLLDQLTQLIPKELQHYMRGLFQHVDGFMQTKEFREWILAQVALIKGLHVHGESVIKPFVIDSLLYESLPLCSKMELPSRMAQILSTIPYLNSKDAEGIVGLLDTMDMRFGHYPLISSKQLQQICLGLIALFYNKPCFTIDWHKQIAQGAQQLGFAFPTPLIFADTNWVRDYFAFVVNPGSHELDLWKVNRLGTRGEPMFWWKMWLNGSRKDIPWTLYSKPWEYTV